MPHALLALLRSAPINSYINSDPEEYYLKARAHQGITNPSIKGTTTPTGIEVLQAEGWVDSWRIARSYPEVLLLLEQGPIVVETLWYHYEAYPDPDDHIHRGGGVHDRDSPVHLVLVYGFDSQYVYFQNSWGNWWGRDGRASMPIEEFALLFTRDISTAYQPYKHMAPLRLPRVATVI